MFHDAIAALEDVSFSNSSINCVMDSLLILLVKCLWAMFKEFYSSVTIPDNRAIRSCKTIFSSALQCGLPRGWSRPFQMEAGRWSREVLAERLATFGTGSSASIYFKPGSFGRVRGLSDNHQGIFQRSKTK